MSEPQYNIPIPFPANADYSKQCVAVPGTKRPGQTAHYRSSASPFVTIETPGSFTNLVDVFEEGLRRGKDGPFLGHRPIISTSPLEYADYHVWQSWKAVDVRRRALGSALHHLFRTGVLGGGELDTVGIWSKNSPTWQIVDLALQAYGKVGVSLYDTLGKDAVEFIVNHAELTIVFATQQHLPSILKLGPKLPGLKMLVSMDPLSQESKDILSSWGEERNIKVHDILELEELGRAHPTNPLPATPETLATICYTSGTTGNPKGVLLTHGNLASTTYAYLHMFDLNSETCMMSFLPLAHIYQRIMEFCVIALGGRVGYTTGDPTLLLEDLRVMRPTFMPSVPRVLNRLYQSAIVAGSVPGLKGALFKRAVQTKLETLRTTGQATHALWDRLVFKKLHDVLGGRMKMITCGSAPISATVMDFLRVALGCEVIEGAYGMTENCGSCVRVWPNDPSSSGTVGTPICNVELKLVDVPAMGYTAEDKPYPRGEIHMRGSQVFKGYYKDEQKTREALDDEGWLHTGDVGLLDDSLRLKIIDRVKNIMKLSQGEYVALEHVENIYSACPLVSQLFVYGDSLQSYLLAVVIPDIPHFAPLASRVLGKSISDTDTVALERAVKDPEVYSAVMAELGKQAKKNKLKGFEMIKRIHLTLEPFTTENGCLTPTMKIRRKETYGKFKAELDALYALPEPTSSKL